jgi:hypothetical protein
VNEHFANELIKVLAPDDARSLVADWLSAICASPGGGQRRGGGR